MAQWARDFMRSFDTFFDLIDEAIFGEKHGGDSAMQRSPGAWQSAIAVATATAIATASVNLVGFIFVLGPQSLLQTEKEDLPPIQRATLDAQLFANLGKTSQEIAERLLARQNRIRDLTGQVFDPADPREGTKACGSLGQASRQNQIEAATDLGRIRAFRDVGFDWARKWAGTLESADSMQLETWQIAESFSEACVAEGRSGPGLKTLTLRLRSQMVTSLAAYAELKSYSENLTPIAQSEIEQLKVQNDATQGRMHTVVELLGASAYCILMIFVLLGLVVLFWLLRRLRVVIAERQKRIDRLTA